MLICQCKSTEATPYLFLSRSAVDLLLCGARWPIYRIKKIKKRTELREELRGCPLRDCPLFMKQTFTLLQHRATRTRASVFPPSLSFVVSSFWELNDRYILRFMSSELPCRFYAPPGTFNFIVHQLHRTTSYKKSVHHLQFGGVTVLYVHRHLVSVCK